MTGQRKVQTGSSWRASGDAGTPPKVRHDRCEDRAGGPDVVAVAVAVAMMKGKLVVVVVVEAVVVAVLLARQGRHRQLDGQPMCRCDVDPAVSKSRIGNS